METKSLVRAVNVKKLSGLTSVVCCLSRGGPVSLGPASGF